MSQDVNLEAVAFTIDTCAAGTLGGIMEWFTVH